MKNLIIVISLCSGMFLHAAVPGCGQFSSQIGRFELPLCEEGFESCLFIYNKTKKDLTITFYYKRDLVGTGQEIVPLPEDQSPKGSIASNKITGFALPRFSWLEKVATGGFGKGKVRLIDILKSSPIVGFSLTTQGASVPQKPMQLLPERRKKGEGLSYEIVLKTKVLKIIQI